MINSKNSLIVEFVGLPGSGKTTLAQRVTERIKTNGYSAIVPTFQHHYITRYTYAFLFFFRNPISNTKIISSILKSKQRSINDFRAVVINLFYKCEIHYRCSTINGVHILEEGIIHALFSILYSSKNQDVLKHLMRDTLYPFHLDFIFLVTAEPNTVIERLLDRGTSRLEKDIRYLRSDEQLAVIDDAVRTYQEIIKKVNNKINLYHFVNNSDLDLHHNTMAITNRIISKIIK